MVTFAHDDIEIIYITICVGDIKYWKNNVCVQFISNFENVLKKTTNGKVYNNLINSFFQYIDIIVLNVF